jgi:hypothetical protein
VLEEDLGMKSDLKGPEWSAAFVLNMQQPASSTVVHTRGPLQIAGLEAVQFLQRILLRPEQCVLS